MAGSPTLSFGDSLVNVIDTDLVMQVLEPIRHTKTTTAKRVARRRNVYSTSWQIEPNIFA
jgi:hypothetical protein